MYEMSRSVYRDLRLRERVDINAIESAGLDKTEATGTTGEGKHRHASQNRPHKVCSFVRPWNCPAGRGVTSFFPRPLETPAESSKR